LDGALLGVTILGTALAAAGSLALNQYLERRLDARMDRTRMRPLPDGRLQPIEALAFGSLLASSGVTVLTLLSGPLPGLVAASRGSRGPFTWWGRSSWARCSWRAASASRESAHPRARSGSSSPR